jgi:hypothetical protein
MPTQSADAIAGSEPEDDIPQSIGPRYLMII